MKYIVLLSLLILWSGRAAGQTNILVTNPEADAVLKGNFSPADYAPAVVIDDPLFIASEMPGRIRPDSLRAFITRLSAFGTRNTGSDTLSDTRGIGAARRWVFDQFQAFSAAEEDRLLVSYLQFDQDICGVGRHRNIFAVLPGTDTANHGVIIVEGHIDSRCSGVCDTACVAEGVEDNASGTVLVMELARVMARYSFSNTIVFLVTIGEEQGLMGAYAFADYCVAQNIPVRAVYNNDIVGGIICGETSSAPSCPGLNHVDSTGVRLFSGGSAGSPNKQLARFVKLEYEEMLEPTAAVPMDVRIMSPEDRSGRGGDHIPFRLRGYPAIRFCSANEHGDASNGPDYDDRQHTEDDILGVDTDGDQVIDSFFVDFNYLARNAAINANAIAMSAQGVPIPEKITFKRNGAEFIVNISDLDPPFRVFLRTTSNDFDTIFELADTTYGVFPCNPGGLVFVSAAKVNGVGIESLFSREIQLFPAVGVEETEPSKTFELLQNRPNPFDESTWISFTAGQVPAFRKASIQIFDPGGRLVSELPIAHIREGLNEHLYVHGYGQTGVYVYRLVVDGQVMDAREMVFAN